MAGQEQRKRRLGGLIIAAIAGLLLGLLGRDLVFGPGRALGHGATQAARPATPSWGSGARSQGVLVGSVTDDQPAGGPTPLVIQARLSGPLVPGVTRDLVVRIANPEPAAVVVEQLRVTVGRPSRTGCNPAWINLPVAETPRLDIAGYASATTRVPIALVETRTDQDACRGAVLPIEFAASARTVPGAA